MHKNAFFHIFYLLSVKIFQSMSAFAIKAWVHMFWSLSIILFGMRRYTKLLVSWNLYSAAKTLKARQNVVSILSRSLYLSFNTAIYLLSMEICDYLLLIIFIGIIYGQKLLYLHHFYRIIEKSLNYIVGMLATIPCFSFVKS